MPRLSAITALLVLVVSTLTGCAQMSGAGREWTTLIDGNTGLDNFNRLGDANWRALDGAIVADKGRGGFLVTKNSYKDFRLKAEFWAAPTTNSGIFIRGSQLVVFFNGVQTVDVRDARFAQGPFALQFANGANNAPGGSIKWRKLQISAL